MPASHSCALLTPSGRGAIAVIAVFGPNLEPALAKLFRSASHQRLNVAAHQTIFYGHWISTGEDVVLVRSSVEQWEIHCHGGQAAPIAILNSLIANGFRELSTGDATEAIHGTGWKSQIATALTQTSTVRTALILLRQYNLVDETLQRLKTELTLDPLRVMAEITDMLNAAKFGKHLTTPWSVVMCGAPNVGKSSLVNALIGFNRVIVHETAGTTRDVVSQLTAVEGWPIELKDTAGLRLAENLIEELGISLSETEISRADLVVVVLDAADEIKASDLNLIRRTNAALIVFNKTDLVPDSILAQAQMVTSKLEIDVIPTSARDKTGIQELIHALANRLVPANPTDGLLIPLTEIHIAILQRCVELVQQNQITEATAAIDRLSG